MDDRIDEPGSLTEALGPSSFCNPLGWQIGACRDRTQKNESDRNECWVAEKCEVRGWSNEVRADAALAKETPIQRAASLRPSCFSIDYRELFASGVTWIKAPGLASSSIQSEPSGPSSTSRMRLPTLQRSKAYSSRGVAYSENALGAFTEADLRRRIRALV